MPSMTTEEAKAYFAGEAAGFKQGVRAGREAVSLEVREELIEQIKDEMYKHLPADEKWDDTAHFFPWDDEKNCVIRTAQNFYRHPLNSA